MNLDQKIEAILFIRSEPITFKKLSGFLGVDEKRVVEALTDLDQKLMTRGLQLIYKDDAVMLGTKSELGPLLEELRKDELNRELSKAALETLAIILYREQATRGDIDYIRGVNSSFILRNLLIRGLIERVTHPKDSRKYFYKPTFDLMAYLGIKRIQDLPEFENMASVLRENSEAKAEAEQK